MENEKEDKPAETPSLLEETKKVVEQLKTENDRREAIQKKEEELEARRMLGGKTDAGIQPPKPAEETPQEYAKRIMSGKL